MRRLLLLAVVAGAGGCVTPADKAQWADAMRDLRGDNMRMRAGPGPAADPDSPRPAPSAD